MQSKSSDRELVKAIIEKLGGIQDMQPTVEYDEDNNVVSLMLGELSLTEIPVEIGQLTNLQALHLNGNALTEISAEILQLTSLQILNLNENQLTQLPLEIGLLSNLRVLSLNRNQLTQLPPEIGQLSNLRELNLARNQLTQLPPEIGQLSNLRELNSEGNYLAQLPPEIEQLSSLRELRIQNNQFVQFPPEIVNLTFLKILAIHGNKITRLLPEIVNLISLEKLFMGDNQFDQVPLEFVQLSNLNLIFMHKNQLTQLPPEIGQLSNLRILNLSNNPDLLTPPLEIIEQGTKAILTFLQELQVDSFMRYEAKLLVVGEGGTGKSSLLKSMRNEEFDDHSSTTHGIEVSQLKLDHPKIPHTEITLNTWDFGGQHIYHATHQFFLTKRSLYLVVWNARLGVEQGRLHFWLDTIKSLAPDAPVLLVATHTDERAPDLNYQLYKDAYPQLVGTFSVSNKEGIGLEDLRAGLAHHAMAIGLVGQPWPTKWIEVEKALIARKEYHVSADRYTRICARRKIQAKMAQGTLGGYLHDLGKILYFRDDYILSNLVILKPNWVTKAISRVLEDVDTGEAKGILAHADLPRIWATDDDGTSYEPHLYPIFLRLMERFDLSYQIDPDKPSNPSNRSLVPQLLPHQPPENIPPWPQIPIGSQTHVEMRYHFDFVPAGIMPWFIVRTHRYTQNMHWREGVVLHYQGHTARVELNPMLRELRLVVWGVQPHNFFTILMNTLDLILDRFEGLRIQREIPCICHWQHEKHVHCPNFFRYELLVRRMDAKRYEVECPESFQMVSVPELLYGIHTSTNDQVIADIRQSQQELIQGQKQVLEISTEMATFLKEINQRAELIWRALLRQWNFEMKRMEAECPNIFFLTPTKKADFTSQNWMHRLVQDGKKRFNPQNWVSQEYGLYLVCQHPSGPHPVGEGYSLREAKDWWINVNPWLNYLVSFLKVAIPVGKAFGDVYDTIDFDHMSHQIALMEEITNNIPALANLDTLANGVPEPHLNHDQRGSELTSVRQLVCLTKRKLLGKVVGINHLTQRKELFAMISRFEPLDQSVLTTLRERDPLVERYRAFFALLDWDAIEPQLHRDHPCGPHPHPETTYIKTFLVKIMEEKRYMTSLRLFLVEHPLLIMELGFHLVPDATDLYGFDSQRTIPTARWLRKKMRHLDPFVLTDLLEQTVHSLQGEIDGLGEVISIDVKHIYAWVRENNPRESIHYRFKKENQPKGDPECRVGGKTSTNMIQSDGSKKERTEYLWGYGTGVVAVTSPVYGNIVLAEYTQTFNQTDVTYHQELYQRTVHALGGYPLHQAADAAFDAWYIYHHSALQGGIAAIPLNSHSKTSFDPDGVPRCPIGLRMHPSFSHTHTNGYQAQRYCCPLLHPKPTGASCDHPQFAKGKGCVKDVNVEKGGQMRLLLDRSSPLYRAVYNQRTGAERINSRAREWGIERPRVRNRRSVERINTLTYIVLNLRTLQNARKINTALLTPKIFSCSRSSFWSLQAA